MTPVSNVPPVEIGAIVANGLSNVPSPVTLLPLRLSIYQIGSVTVIETLPGVASTLVTPWSSVTS